MIILTIFGINIYLYVFSSHKSCIIIKQPFNKIESQLVLLLVQYTIHSNIKNIIHCVASEEFRFTLFS